MNGKLILMVGCPGAGKSTWLQQHKQENEIIVSRDQIRFKMLQEGEDYFSKEDQVWLKYIAAIEWYINHGETVYADATHLNKRARLKLLNVLLNEPTEIEIIYFNIPLEVAQERNAKRAGRAYVPPKAVERMYHSLEEPQWKEGKFTYNKIYIVDENGNMEEKK